MIPAGFDYLAPTTLDEALRLLGRPDAAPLAGGHALLPAMKLRSRRPGLVVDLGRIPELHGIRRMAATSGDGGNGAAPTLTIGSMTTTADIEHSPELHAAAPLLPTAAQVISDPMIRNRATIGGSLVQADPHGDWPAVALAAAATLRLRSLDGERTVPVERYYAEPCGADGASTAELLTAVTVPAFTRHTRATYLKRTDPASGYAEIGVAVVADVEDGTCRSCRIGVTGVRSTAFRATDLEQRLLGHVLTSGLITSAVDASLEAAGPENEDASDRPVDLLPIYLRRGLLLVTAATDSRTER